MIMHFLERGFKALLSDFRFIGEILEAANGLELLELLEKEEKKPDIILLDIKMPGNGRNRSYRLKLRCYTLM